MRILSGIQCSGKLHIGNYFGAVVQFLEWQETGEGFYFIADLHAMTTIRDSEIMRRQVLDVALDYLAFGLDPDKCTLFVQSEVPEVSELQWILSTVTPMGLLQRSHSYKDKIAQGVSPDAGLFMYPVLMAADILIYDSDIVPVGKDQKQHLEITRDIAVKFNATYCKDFDPQTGEGGVLKLPTPRINEATAVVPGTDGRKMSKSYGNTIDPFAPDKALKKSVMGVVTDSTPLEDPKNPAECNVFALLKLFCTPEEEAEISSQYAAGGVGYGDFKKRLLERVHDRFDPVRKKREELEKDPDYVREVLRAGARRAREVASGVLERVKTVTGLG